MSEVRRGYKQTGVGVIPEEWEAAEVGTVCGCIVPGRNKPRRFDGKIPWITTPDLEDGRDVVSSRLGLCISTAEARSVGSKIVPFGSVLMSCAGELGIVAICRNDLVVNQQLHAFLPGERIKAGFLLNALSSRKQAIVGAGTKTAVPYLNKTSCNSVAIPLPPLPEQEAIAEALSDADALIESLEQLLTKKRQTKQGAMQELLTGKKRLPGFTVRWKAIPLGTTGAWLSGGTPAMSVSEYWEGDIPWVSPKDMKVRRIHDAIDHVSTTALSAGTRLVQAGAILMVVRGMILAHSFPVARVEKPVAFNQDIKALVVRPGVDSNFLLWWLTANESLVLSLTNESTHGTKRMPTEVLFALQVALPEEAEQTAIATVLSDMDDDIAALETKLTKARHLKQGMMQELLTGKIRLV